MSEKLDKAVAEDQSRQSETVDKEFDVSTSAAEIQRGKIQEPQFYGDQSSSAGFGKFMAGAQKAADYVGAARVLINDLIPERKASDQDNFRITEFEMTEISKKSMAIARYSNLPHDVIEEFLVILCYVNNMSDMRLIADAVQIPELTDSSIWRQPMQIISIPNLEKIAFCASAVEGLVSMFRRYVGASQYTGHNKGEETKDILANIGLVVSGIQGLGAALENATGSAASAMGSFMSELLLGQRVPMNVIAKNPTLQSPSYTGKVFFGESATALANVDIDQDFAKKIASFPKPSNGVGTASFGMANLKSFSNSMPITGLISQIMTGNQVIKEGTAKFNQVMDIAGKIQNLTGGRPNEIIDIRRADTAIPMLSAFSKIIANSEKTSPFGQDTFSRGWVMQCSVSNVLQSNGSQFMQTVKRFL